MNIDLGSPVLDIAIGLSFVFFLLSVIASAINEGIAGILNLRGKTLKEGLEGMIGDPHLVEELLDHDLVRTELDKEARGAASARQLFWSRFVPKSLRRYERASSYLAPEIFAVAFDQIYSELPEKERIETVRNQVGALSKPGVDTPASWQKKLEDWFNSDMERVGGWYKRRAQIFVFLIAIVVTIGLNANAIRITERLATDPATRTAVVATAEKALEKEVEDSKGEGDAEKEIEEAGTHFGEAAKEVEALNVPLFWAGDNKPSNSSWETVAAGWLVTVIAISLGAPFWFDTLGKLSNLRSTGEKPEDKTK